ncbi:hypothetical protein ACTQXY_10065 [Faecalimonas sp. LCP19S3_D12]
MKKTISLLLAVAIILTGNTLSVHAKTKQENLPDSEVVEEFDVFDTNIIDETEEIPDIQTRSHITYKVTKLNCSSEIGAYTGQSVSGEPGVTISLSQMKATSFSASSNVAWNVKEKAQATLGFSFSKSYTIGHSGSKKVPSTYNGRKVKRAELKAYRLYDKHTFKVTWTSIHVKQPQYYGTYWAKKPSGYHYKMVYYYK